MKIAYSYIVYEPGPMDYSWKDGNGAQARGTLQGVLNAISQEGWRVVTSFDDKLIHEKAVSTT